MNDQELDDLLSTWKVPEPRASLRAGLMRRFPARPPRKLLGLRPRWIIAFAAAAGALALAQSLVNDATLASDAGPWDAGIYVRRTQLIHPFVAKFAWWSNREGHTTGRKWEGGKIAGSVYIIDRATRVHYGYTWNAEALGGGKYRFTTLPLDPSVLVGDGPISPLARPIPPIVVGAGSTFEVDLYAARGQRLYDRYELSGQPLPVPKLKGPSILTLTRPQLYLNGAFALGPGGVGEIAGNRVTIVLRDRGKYVLMLDPLGDVRFVLAGRTRGNTIEFESGGDQFRIVCSAPITTGDSDVYLYMQKDVNENASGFSGGGPPAPLPQTGGPDHITLTKPQLYIDGVLALDSGGVITASGERVFVDLRGRGRYILGLDPLGDSRFLLAGYARRNTIEFLADGDLFRIVCTAPVASGGDRNVYLLLKKDAPIRESRFGGGGQ